MRKFVFMIMVFVLSVGTVDMAFGRADKSKVDIHYEEICVQREKTYWNIAKKYNADGMSRKEYSKYIMDFNGAVNDEIEAGQKIVVPVIKYI